MLKVHFFTFNPFQENTYVVFDEDTKEAAIIDPGCYDSEEEEALLAFVKKEKLQVKHLINTHCHIDHVLGNDFVSRTYGLGLQAHAKDEPVLKAVITYAPNYGFHRYKEVEIAQYLEEGDEVKIGNHLLEVRFTPGHAPGHIVLYHEEGSFVIGGDVLFDGSIGRTDLPGGNHGQLIRSIKDKMLSLPDDTIVYAGHMGPTSIGKERRTNPFLR